MSQLNLLHGTNNYKVEKHVNHFSNVLCRRHRKYLKGVVMQKSLSAQHNIMLYTEVGIQCDKLAQVVDRTLTITRILNSVRPTMVQFITPNAHFCSTDNTG